MLITFGRSFVATELFQEFSLNVPCRFLLVLYIVDRKSKALSSQIKLLAVKILVKREMIRYLPSNCFFSAAPSAQEGKKHLSAVAISGIVLGSVAVSVVVCATLFIARRYRRKSDDNHVELEMYAGTAGTVNQAITA